MDVVDVFIDGVLFCQERTYHRSRLDPRLLRTRPSTPAQLMAYVTYEPKVTYWMYCYPIDGKREAESFAKSVVGAKEFSVGEQPYPDEGKPAAFLVTYSRLEDAVKHYDIMEERDYNLRKKHLDAGGEKCFYEVEAKGYADGAAEGHRQDGDPQHVSRHQE